jgi:hypothetical protein
MYNGLVIHLSITIYAAVANWQLIRMYGWMYSVKFFGLRIWTPNRSWAHMFVTYWSVKL